MKKKISLIMVSIVLAVSLAGCGIVTVVPIGEEASFTGKEAFDSGAQSSDDWSAVVEDIKGKAADVSEVLANGADGTAVSGSAKIVEFNTETPKHYLVVEVEGYSGGEVRIQAGGVYSGTAIRDAQSVKAFEDFANQTEWSQYAKALNQEADTQVVAPLSIDESVAGKTVTFTGAAAEGGGAVTITPVEMTIE